MLFCSNRFLVQHKRKADLALILDATKVVTKARNVRLPDSNLVMLRYSCGHGQGLRGQPLFLVLMIRFFLCGLVLVVEVWMSLHQQQTLTTSLHRSGVWYGTILVPYLPMGCGMVPPPCYVYQVW